MSLSPCSFIFHCQVSFYPTSCRHVWHLGKLSPTGSLRSDGAWLDARRQQRKARLQQRPRAGSPNDVAITTVLPDDAVEGGLWGLADGHVDAAGFFLGGVLNLGCSGTYIYIYICMNNIFAIFFLGIK